MFLSRMSGAAIRLVTFDALHTLITPREPVHTQYARVFERYLGAEMVDVERVKSAFKVALKEVQRGYPSYPKGAEHWWREVIRRTAFGASVGLDEREFDSSLQAIVQRLMMLFSSSEGYKAFGDAISTVRQLHEQLGVRTAVLSNGDGRIRNVLKDLSFPPSLDPVVLSEEEGIEKPSRDIFDKVLGYVNQNRNVEKGRMEIIKPNECLHVGDELECDYRGALGSSWQALLVRREGVEGEWEHKEVGEDLKDVNIIKRLEEVVEFVEKSRR